jgi:hypothetical protein
LIAGALNVKLKDIYHIQTPAQSLLEKFRAMAGDVQMVEGRKKMLRVAKRRTSLALGGPDTFHAGDQVQISIFPPFAGRMTLLCFQPCTDENDREVHLLDPQLENFPKSIAGAGEIRFGPVEAKEPYGAAAIVAIMVRESVVDRVKWIEGKSGQGFPPNLYLQAKDLSESLVGKATDIQVSVFDFVVAPAPEPAKFGRYGLGRRIGLTYPSRPASSPDVRDAAE